MSKLLRKVKRAYWKKPTWLPVGEVPATAITDLPNKESSLSFWRVATPMENDMAVLALAVNASNFDNLDIYEVDENIILAAGIKIVDTLGETAYTSANPLHVSLEELTTRSIDSLCKQIISNGKIVRYQERDLISRAKDNKSYFDLSRLKEGILSKL